MTGLARLRANVGLTQAGLARMTGVHRTTIVRIEAAGRAPRADIAVLLAPAFGMTSSELIERIERDNAGVPS